MIWACEVGVGLGLESANTNSINSIVRRRLMAAMAAATASATSTRSIARPSVATSRSSSFVNPSRRLSALPIRRIESRSLFSSSTVSVSTPTGYRSKTTAEALTDDGLDLRQSAYVDLDSLNVGYEEAAVPEQESEETEQEAEQTAATADDDVSRFNLHSDTRKALAKRGIKTLFPIQIAAIEPALAGRDVIARAKTGTGKTLAFSLPVIEKLLEMRDNGALSGRGRAPKCLVLAPTRELAKQVEREILETAPNLGTACVYGGAPMGAQANLLARGVDVVVGTPGRLIDCIARGLLRVDEVSFLVLDEADQMLADGFEEEVEKILEGLPPKRQTMLFSATMPDWVRKLSRRYLDNPVIIDLVGERETKFGDGIRLLAVKSSFSARRSLLVDLITVYGRGAKAIIFAQTKREVDEVTVALAKSIPCECLHGDVPQSQREKTLAGFRQNRFSVLVATDVAARGLDISDVDLVVHYELPNQTESFLHRSGRTGRAGKQGTAIAMFSEKESRDISVLERETGARFERISPPTPMEVLAASAEQSIETIQKVDPSLVQYFLPAAEKYISDAPGSPQAVLALALAALSGIREPPPPRSLLTCEQGVITVCVTSVAGSKTAFGGMMPTPRSIMTLVSRHVPEAANVIGKIKLISDRNQEGAVFDVPEKYAKELVATSDSRHVFTIPDKLPKLIEDASASSTFSRSGRPGLRPSRGSGGDRPYGGGYRSRDRDSGRDGERDSWDSRGRYGDSKPSFGRSDRNRSDRPSDRGGYGGGRFSDRKPSYSDSRPAGGDRPGGYGDKRRVWGDDW